MHNPRRTPYHDQHVASGGRLMNIAGWARPLHYGSPVQEVNAVRNGLAILDLHPMNRLKITGRDALNLVDLLVPSDVHTALRRARAQYTCLCDEQGGIIDDVLVFPKHSHELLITSNVAPAETVNAWVTRYVAETGLDVRLENISASETQLAVQGPEALRFMEEQLPQGAPSLRHFEFTETVLDGIPVFLTRTGYTGETGFELFFSSKQAAYVWQHLMTAGSKVGLIPFGVLAAQILRTEKGYPLYGMDMTPENNPFEVGLGWTVRSTEGHFIARQALATIKERAPAKRLRRFYLPGNTVAPRGTAIQCDDNIVGEVTSCCESPTIQRVIGMGLFSETSFREPCWLRVRGERLSLSFTDRPFYDPDNTRLHVTLG